MTFDEWMIEADRECEALVGLGLLDLPDVAFRDMYDDGESPLTAAKTAILEAGGGELL